MVLSVGCEPSSLSCRDGLNMMHHPLASILSVRPALIATSLHNSPYLGLYCVSMVKPDVLNNTNTFKSYLQNYKMKPSTVFIVTHITRRFKNMDVTFQNFQIFLNLLSTAVN